MMVVIWFAMLQLGIFTMEKISGSSNVQSKGRFTDHNQFYSYEFEYRVELKNAIYFISL
jgi:hypothetical protein